MAESAATRQDPWLRRCQPSGPRWLAAERRHRWELHLAWPGSEVRPGRVAEAVPQSAGASAGAKVASDASNVFVPQRTLCKCGISVSKTRTDSYFPASNRPTLQQCRRYAQA